LKISYCVPVHNRTYDLRKAFPSIVKAANFSPPVEIAILNYDSFDDLEHYMLTEMWETKLEEKNTITYSVYYGKGYYHMAHARNVSAKRSEGYYLVLSSADIILPENFFLHIREHLKEDDYLWLRHPDRWVGVIAVQREEFMSAGGYDERFEFYGKEDKDLIKRLERRGGKWTTLSTRPIIIPTPNEDKIKNYRLKLTKKDMGSRAKKIYYENIKNKVLIANEGKDWGSWD